MNNKRIGKFTGIVAALIIIGAIGCWYDMDDEKHPTEPGRTGVQGWSLFTTVTPATVPANGTSTMQVQARFWDLENRYGVPDQLIYMSLYDLDTGSPANPREVHFGDGGITTEVWTNNLGLADATIYAEYLNKSIAEKQYYVRAEATVDFDNTALNIWDTHSFRLYNPYWDGKPTTVPADSNRPTAAFYYFPTKPTTDDTITFDGSSSYDTDATGRKAYDEIVSYRWYFGDGETGYGDTVSHRYYTEGTYTVELVVTDDEGMFSSITGSVEVSAP
ncbi:PKD domain-containing protein [bacterium]|nr:PKD domain-containing protein [candidate division CSSED10-310 bacterium]